MESFIDTIVFQIIPLLIAIICHEISHGLAAYALGDDTAKRAGRFKLHTHFDLYGSFLIPLGLYIMHSPIMIGYAKPVPINPMKFKDPLADMALVAIAGPLFNLIAGTVSALLLPHSQGVVLHILVYFTMINFGLFFFNLIPIPPLDGSRILAAVIPERFVPAFYRLEPFGLIIIIALESLSSSLSNALGINISLFHNFIELPTRNLLSFFISN